MSLFPMLAVALIASADRTADGHIRRWLILAPVAYDVEPQEANLDRSYLADEASVRPRVDEAVTVNGRTLVWRKYLAAEHFVDFNGFLGQQTEFATAYAVTYLHADRSIANVTLKFGSDDHCKVYLNGRMIFRHVGPRGASKDQDAVGRLVLRSGVNVLMLKVCNGNSDWGCCARLLGADGRPVEGVTASWSADSARRR